jgi:hypothetical protein
MTVRLRVQYGKFPPNTNFSGGAAIEAELLSTGQADTNTAAGVTWVDPVPTELSGPTSISSSGGTDLLLADGRELLDLSAARSLVSGGGNFDATDAGTEWAGSPAVLGVQAILTAGGTTTVLVEVKDKDGVVSTAATITADTISQVLRDQVALNGAAQYRLRRSSGTGTVSLLVQR